MTSDSNTLLFIIVCVITDHLQGRGRGSVRGGRGGNMDQQQQQQQPGAQSQQTIMQTQLSNRLQHKGPQVVPTMMGNSTNTTTTTTTAVMMGNQQSQQGNAAGAPNLMQKLNEITAPGGDILSKGKELIFMKFGLGGK